MSIFVLGFSLPRWLIKLVKCSSVRPCGVNVFKTLTLRDCWADISGTWHVYSTGLETMLLGSAMPNLAWGTAPHPDLGDYNVVILLTWLAQRLKHVLSWDKSRYHSVCHLCELLLVSTTASYQHCFSASWMRDITHDVGVENVFERDYLFIH